MPKSKTSAGLLMCRIAGAEPEVLLVHPGGPYFRNKDAGAWTVPKGLVSPGEGLLEGAKREFVEETGFDAGPADFVALGEIRMKSGKQVFAWAFAGECDEDAVRSNTFEMEWPPRSGRMRSFAEVDRAGWFDRGAAIVKIVAAQQPFVERALSVQCLETLFG